MEDDIKNNPKYQKVLLEYQKLRASAKVLKNAVIDEKSKVSSLEEQLRLQDQQQRRLASDNDSLLFRNKQLEFRVQVLQEELQKTIKTRSGKNSTNNSQASSQQLDAIIADELEKKIIENAQLSSSISDKTNQIEMLNHRLRDIEKSKTELEKKSRIELEQLNNKIADLELKLAGISNHSNENDDISLDAASDSTIPVHMTLASDERIQFLEKELNFYRHQYEVLKLNNTLKQHSTLTAAMHEKDLVDSGGDAKNQDDDEERTLTKEEKIYRYFTSTFEKILSEKSESDSKATNYMKECEMLKENIEILLENLQQKETDSMNLKTNFDRMEEDSITTRLNYEEQIQLLTEQVLLLSSRN